MIGKIYVSMVEFYDIKNQKSFVVHFAGTGNDWRESSDDWHETSQHDSN